MCKIYYIASCSSKVFACAKYTTFDLFLALEGCSQSRALRSHSTKLELPWVSRSQCKSHGFMATQAYLTRIRVVHFAVWISTNAVLPVRVMPNLSMQRYSLMHLPTFLKLQPLRSPSAMLSQPSTALGYKWLNGRATSLDSSYTCCIHVTVHTETAYSKCGREWQYRFSGFAGEALIKGFDIASHKFCNSNRTIMPLYSLL